MTGPASGVTPVRPSRAAVIAVLLTVAALVAIGLILGGPEPVMSPGGTRMLRRIPPPPPDLATLLRRFGVGSTVWHACILSIPPLWWAAYRFPLTQVRALRSLALQLLIIGGLIFLATIAEYVDSYGGTSLAPSFTDYFPVALVSATLPMLAAAALVNALEARRRAVRGAVDAQRLRAELAESRLAAVTTQLQPHFLFNTLQGISTLIHKDPASADAMLAKLSDLLRDVLRRSRSALVPLGDELRMTATYLELAQMRFGDRLDVSVDVDEAAHSALVPVLLLQPLLENALKHGIGRRAAGGRVGVTARARDGRLTISVWDDGVGLDGAGLNGATPQGTGLANMRERLRHAFGDDQSLDIRERAGGGVDVTIHVPLRTDVA
jgi:two-component system, LytTR family, sensor kinase